MAQSFADLWLEEHHAGGWRCIQTRVTVYYSVGNYPHTSEQIIENGIHMNDACRFQYGSGAWAAYDDWDDPYSWSCYR